MEERVYQAVKDLQPNAYGLAILEALDYKPSLGALYASLERLVAEGYLVSHEGPPIPERGNRSRRFYETTGKPMPRKNEPSTKLAFTHSFGKG